ncbi:MAG: DUF2493 domain-containing protein [Phreatobacter sp.]
MRLLICGGRHYDDAAAICRELDRLHGGQPIDVLIHGGLVAIGTVAEAWARQHNVHVIRYPPNWTLLGTKAEARRNAFMLADSRPDFLLAFPGGRDTADLVRMARAAELPVWLAHVRADGSLRQGEGDADRAAGEATEDRLPRFDGYRPRELAGLTWGA